MKAGKIKWGELALSLFFKIGRAVLKLVGFASWVILSGINLLLRELADSLKRWLFPKDYD